MKKILSVILTLCVLFLLTACGTEHAKNTTNDSSDNISTYDPDANRYTFRATVLATYEHSLLVLTDDQQMLRSCDQYRLSLPEGVSGNDFKKDDIVVIGVSKDSVASHVKFAQKYDLPFILLADPELQAIQAYDVWKEKKLYGKVSMGVVRTTYIIDENGMTDVKTPILCSFFTGYGAVADKLNEIAAE